MMSYQPTISIIIAVKNASALLQETLDSIRQQQYKLETIVIDGGSEDGIQDVVMANKDIVSHFVSEPDQGISDAFNKGLKLASGDYINFQGAGDTLYSPLCVAELFADLDNRYQLVCGKIVRVKEDGITPIWIAPKKIKPFNRNSLLFKMSLPHQALFTHRQFFEKYGNFALAARFAMDYELLLRAYKSFPKTMVKDVIIARWRAGGIGANRTHEIFDEYHRIKMQHQVAHPAILRLIDKYTRFKFHVKSRLLRGE